MEMVTVVTVVAVCKLNTKRQVAKIRLLFSRPHCKDPGMWGITCRKSVQLILERKVGKIKTLSILPKAVYPVFFWGGGDSFLREISGNC